MTWTRQYALVWNYEDFRAGWQGADSEGLQPRRPDKRKIQWLSQGQGKAATRQTPTAGIVQQPLFVLMMFSV
jgi:hypothetical protein